MKLSPDSLAKLHRELGCDGRKPGIDAEKDRTQRRAGGIFFTPWPLARFVAERVLQSWFEDSDVAWRPDGSPKMTILDPAAGDGRFLVCAREFLVKKAIARGFNEVRAQKAIEKQCLIAVELDRDFTKRIQRTLPNARCHCGEALGSEELHDQTIDIVLGNPPYMRSGNLAKTHPSLYERIKGVYRATSYGEWDVSAAFMEQGLNWLRVGGCLGMVVPSRWWTARWAGPLRNLLVERGATDAIVDFGASQLFVKATVYTSVFFASTPHSQNVIVARPTSPRHNDWCVEEIATTLLGGQEPWNLSIGAVGQFTRGLTELPRLGDLADIKKGVGTNADSVFLLDKEEAAQVEPGLLRRMARGRDVTPFGQVPLWPQLLVPYDSDGTLLSPTVMRHSYPRAYAYFTKHRLRLEARENGRFQGDTFYCFGRPQSMRFHGESSPKVVVPDVTKNGIALIDVDAAFVLDSTYAIRPHKSANLPLESLCGILNSRIVRLWLKQHGIVLRGDYLRMKTAYLAHLPIPKEGVHRDRIGYAVKNREDHEEIDELVRLAYGATLSQWNALELTYPIKKGSVA